MKTEELDNIQNMQNTSPLKANNQFLQHLQMSLNQLVMLILFFNVSQ